MSARPDMETDRLLGTRPVPEDIDAYCTLLLSAPVQSWLRPPPLQPMRPIDVSAILERDRAHWEVHGVAPWIWRQRSDDALVGRVGWMWTTIDGVEAAELVWAVVPERWGAGLASEAASATVARAREDGVAELVARTLPDNAASRAVMRRIGMTEVGDTTHAGLPHVLYRLVL